MQGEKQRAICEFFGEGNQIMKAHEEFSELQEAFTDYLNNQNKDTLKHALNELNDLQNVFEGLCIQLGGNLEEIATEKEYKLNRTIDIINKCRVGKCKIEEYNRLRG